MSLYQQLIATQNKILKEYNRDRASINFEKDNIKDILLREQKKIIEKYGENPYVHDALSGTKSLRVATEELAISFKGIRQFMPRTIDKELNARIEVLEEVIPNAYRLSTRGVYFPDNIITGGVYAGLAFQFMTELFIQLYQPVAPKGAIAELKRINYFASPFMITALAPVFGFFLNTTFRGKKKALREAVFIDHKINEIKKLEEKI
jgi:hypothetical protein